MKKIVTLLLVLSISAAMALPAFALSPKPASDMAAQEESVTRAEEFQWRYRINNGKMQKRLWSITYGYWITDWMPYDTPYPYP